MYVIFIMTVCNCVLVVKYYISSTVKEVTVYFGQHNRSEACTDYGLNCEFYLTG